MHSLTYKHGNVGFVHNLMHYLHFPEKQCFPLQIPPGFAEQRLKSWDDYDDADGVEPGDFVRLTCPLVSSAQIFKSIVIKRHVGQYQLIPLTLFQGTWLRRQR